jgi:capsular polysaccharide biosynthesis protein
VYATLDDLKTVKTISLIRLLFSAVINSVIKFPGLASLLKSSWLPTGTITTGRLGAAHGVLRIEVLYPEVTIALTPPSAFGIQSIPQFNQAESVQHRPTKVIELRDCRVTGTFPVVISSEGNLITDLLCVWSNAPQKHEIFKKIRLPKPAMLSGTTLLIATSYGNNYYHWLVEQLPKMHLAHLAGYNVKNFDHVVCTFGTENFIDESLEFFPDIRAKMLPCTRNHHWRCECLVAFNPSAEHGMPTQWGIDYIRTTILASIPRRTLRNRIYITRKLARGRKVKNESEVFEFLEKHGFRKVALESLSFLEQVELFASAEAVIGPHGAGFTNVLFAPRDCIVVEFMMAAYPATCYAHLSRIIGQKYCYIVAAEELADKNVTLKDMTVPIRALETAVVKLGL